MKDEIKEILPDDFYLNNNNEMVSEIKLKDLNKIIDYITNLQEENEELREDNFAYHQLMKMQNKREYRSKFLKDFQKEYGENVFPDYDEIYKRYDDYKTRNDKQEQELERYKNIIDELEKYIERHFLGTIATNILNKLKELKGSDSNE